MNDCEKYREMISRLIDDDLCDSEKVILATHLKNCGDCTALYRAFLAVSSNMPDDTVAPPVGFTENVMAGVRRSTIRKHSRSTAKRILAAAACLVLVVAVGYRLMPRAGSAAPETPYMAPPAAECADCEEAAPEAFELPAPEPDEMPAELAEAPKASLFFASGTGNDALKGAASGGNSVNEYAANRLDEASDENEHYISDEAYQALLSSLTPCAPPDELDRQLRVCSASGSIDLLFADADVYALIGGEYYAVSYSADDVLAIISN